MKGSKLAARLALACAAWRLAAQPRPLHPGARVEDEDRGWDAETAALADEARAWLSPIREEQARALRLLRDRGAAGEAARAAARAAVVRRWGASLLPLEVHTFGTGWRELGSAGIT